MENKLAICFQCCLPADKQSPTSKAVSPVLSGLFSFKDALEFQRVVSFTTGKPAVNLR